MESVRKKRSNDGVAQSRRQELEDLLAVLRDQETVLTRTIELVQAAAVPGNKAQKHQLGTQHGSAPSRPTAEPKDFEMRQRHIRDDQKRRAKVLWTELRKMVKHLKAKGSVKIVFGAPVRTTAWGAIPENWEKYCAVISEPMDIGTIQARLGEDENRRQYKSPMELHADFKLIVDNARVAKVHAQVLDAATELEQAFSEKWREGKYEYKWNTELALQKLEAQVCCGACLCIVLQASCLCCLVRGSGQQPECLAYQQHIFPSCTCRGIRGAASKTR
jgi:hypothetical protein